MSKSTALGRGMATAGILGTLAAAAVGVARADETVKIGEAAPVTGPASYLGKDTENGARLAIEEINQTGLVIGGRKVTLIFDAQRNGLRYWASQRKRPPPGAALSLAASAGKTECEPQPALAEHSTLGFQSS